MTKRSTEPMNRLQRTIIDMLAREAADLFPDEPAKKKPDAQQGQKQEKRTA